MTLAIALTAAGVVGALKLAAAALDLRQHQPARPTRREELNQ